MSELLFVNACVRGERSRTLALARRFLDAYKKSHPEVRVTERDLMEERLEPQYPEVLEGCPVGRRAAGGAHVRPRPAVRRG